MNEGLFANLKSNSNKEKNSFLQDREKNTYGLQENENFTLDAQKSMSDSGGWDGTPLPLTHTYQNDMMNSGDISVGLPEKRSVAPWDAQIAVQNNEYNQEVEYNPNRTNMSFQDGYNQTQVMQNYGLNQYQSSKPSSYNEQEIQQQQQNNNDSYIDNQNPYYSQQLINQNPYGYENGLNQQTYYPQNDSQTSQTSQMNQMRNYTQPYDNPYYNLQQQSMQNINPYETNSQQTGNYAYNPQNNVDVTINNPYQTNANFEQNMTNTYNFGNTGIEVEKAHDHVIIDKVANLNYINAGKNNIVPGSSQYGLCDVSMGEWMKQGLLVSIPIFNIFYVINQGYLSTFCKYPTLKEWARGFIFNVILTNLAWIMAIYAFILLFSS